MRDFVEDKNSVELVNNVEKSYTVKELFEILKNINLSEFVKNNTQKWKEYLNKLIEKDPKVREALIYIISNYKKKRKNNPEKFGWMHCVEAATLMTEHWFTNSDEVAAAILHDVREDIPNGEEYLRSTYNENTVNLVKSLTEGDKSWYTPEKEKSSWYERKSEEMGKISKFSPNELALKLADQISNIAETVNDLENLFPEDRQKYWEWFNAGYDKQIWKYSTLNEIIQKRIQTCKEEQLFQNEDEEKNLQMFADSFQWLVNTLKSLMSES